MEQTHDVPGPKQAGETAMQGRPASAMHPDQREEPDLRSRKSMAPLMTVSCYTNVLSTLAVFTLWEWTSSRGRPQQDDAPSPNIKDNIRTQGWEEETELWGVGMSIKASCPKGKGLACIRIKSFLAWNRLAWSAYLQKKGQAVMEQPFGLLPLEEELPEKGLSPLCVLACTEQNAP